MSTVLDKTVQALSDVTGFVVDRTVIPEKVIGQAWIISKSRMVILASSVANYADAPWALLVKFPYPDLTFSVKAISLHPEFNKRAARDFYLSQATEITPQAPNFENDIATITIDAEIPDLSPEKMQELNRALSLPLTISAQDLSGGMREGETGNILQKAIMSGRNGVLSFYDERKVPFCRILIKSNKILKASFLNLQNEFAVCELMWRKPGGNFVLQSTSNLNWSGIPEIQMPTDQLASEASRRTQDIPRMIDALGGPNARYVRTRPNIELNQINNQIRWVVERIWNNLDGALSISNLAEKLSVDTYTAIQALWEMKHLGLVGIAEGDFYHRSGQLGAPLTPGHDVDLKFWDNLQGFYLDEVSTSPVLAQGNYFGSYQLLQLTKLLHTMPLPNAKYGAIVLRDGRLIGLHNGKFIANLPSPPPFPLSQMNWIGSLSDMSAKRMRAHASAEEGPELEPEELPTIVSGRGTITGMKTRAVQAAVLESAGSKDTGEYPSQQLPQTASNEPEILQKFTKLQILGVGGGMFVIGLALSFVSIMAPKPTAVVQAIPVKKPPIASNQPKVPSGGEALKQGLKLASFRSETIPPFEFTDTSERTAPKLSFGMESEQHNQKILLVAWPNADVGSAVESNAKQPPFVELKPLQGKVIQSGQSGMHNFYWKAIRYLSKDDKDTVALVGAFTSTDPEKSVLVVATPFKDSGDLDYKNTVNTIERMFVEKVEGSQQSSNGGVEEATAEEIDAYRQNVGNLIKAAYKPPLDAERANRCQYNFEIEADGTVAHLEKKYSSGMDEVDKAVLKAITNKTPFPIPPRTKENKVLVQVNEEANEFTFTEY